MVKEDHKLGFTNQVKSSQFLFKLTQNNYN